MNYFIDLDASLDLLKPKIIPRLMSALLTTSKLWNGSDTRAFDSAARAMWWHRTINFEARRLLANDIEFRNRRNQYYFLCEERLSLRVKLFGRGLLTVNNETETSRAWKQQAPLPGMEPGARLNFGYRLNPLGNAIRDAFITLPDGEAQSWVIQLDGPPVNDMRIQPRLRDQFTTAFDQLYVYYNGWRVGYGS